MYMKKIAIFRALYLGDMLLAVPALRAIRQRFPEAEISLIGLPWMEAFVHRLRGYVDRFVEFGGYSGIEEVEIIPERSQRFIKEQKAYGYDLVIQMHGSGCVSNAVVAALHGKETLGYYIDDCGYTLTRGLPYPDDQPEVYRNLGLAKPLGCSKLDPQLEFPLFPEDQCEAAHLLQQLPRADRPWIGIHTGAKMPVRRWSVEHFAQVADYFAETFQAQIILTGSADEETTVQLAIEKMHSQPLNIAGKTSLGGLAGVIRELDLFISNDTGPAHVANAVDTPSVTIFGPTDPQRWASLDVARHPFVREPVMCSPCGFWECPIDHRCLRWVQPHKVIKVAEELLLRGTVTCNV